MGTQLREVRSGLRYIPPSTCFETFPFPEPDEAQREAIANAAARLNELREGWLNPVNTDGSPALSGKDLARRTLTNLYNRRPDWLNNAHMSAGRRRGRRLRVARQPGRRGNPGTPAGPEPGTGRRRTGRVTVTLPLALHQQS